MGVRIELHGRHMEYPVMRIEYGSKSSGVCLQGIGTGYSEYAAA